jgi:L-alanine-DL-glutamate epimerase-like enolase superfamily enzyme
MKITKVEAIPLWAAFADAFGSADQVPESLARPAFGMRKTPLGGQGGVIVRIETDAGLVGIGESMGRPGARGMAALINDALAPMLIGEDPRRVRVHYEAMAEELRFAPMALSGVDIALWDLHAKANGESLTQSLGGAFHSTIDCYASPVPFHAQPEDSARAAQDFTAQGFTALKLKIGRGVDTDIEHVSAIRASIAPDTRLLVDANGAYTVSEAIRLARRLLTLDVYWLEEPVHPEYVDDLAAIRKRVDLPIASGEWLGSPYQFRDLIGAVDVLMPNITRCGGYTGFMRIADMAHARNVQIAPHGVGLGIGITAALHACASIPNFLIYEYNQLFNPLRHTVMNEPLHMSGGALQVPEDSRAGLGITLNEDTLSRYRLV